MAGRQARPSLSGRLLDEPVFTEPLLGYLVLELPLYVDLRVQLLQLVGGELLGDGREQLRDLRVLFHCLLAHVERGVVDGEEAFVVLYEFEIQVGDAPVGLEHLAEVAALAPVGLLVDLPLVDLDDVLARELEAVGFLHARQAVVTGRELGSHAYGGFLRVLLDQLFEVRELLDAEILVGFAAHGDGVGVVGRRWRFQPLDVVLLEVLLGDGFELFLAIGYGIRVAEVGDPAGPRVLPVHVDLAGFKRLAGGDRSGQPDLVFDRRPGVLEDLQRDLTEDQLLGEFLGTDGNLRARQIHIPGSATATTATAAAHDDNG